MRNNEVLNYNVQPSQEGRMILAMQALSRIVEIDGIEMLDGYWLPPSDDDEWVPDREIVAHHIDYRTDPPEDSTTIFKSRLTNNWVREMNILAIASGQEPPFVKWEEVNLNLPKIH